MRGRVTTRRTYIVLVSICLPSVCCKYNAHAPGSVLCDDLYKSAYKEVGGVDPVWDNGLVVVHVLCRDVETRVKRVGDLLDNAPLEYS